jgi:hypothetical protein
MQSDPERAQLRADLSALSQTIDHIQTAITQGDIDNAIKLCQAWTTKLRQQLPDDHDED